MMAVRIRMNGDVVCAAMHEAKYDDIYLDDGLHYYLSVEKKVLVTEPMNELNGLGGHSSHGLWWWKGFEPDDAIIDPFYYES